MDYSHLYQAALGPVANVETAKEQVQQTRTQMFGNVERVNGNIGAVGGGSAMNSFINRKLQNKDVYRNMKNKTVYNMDSSILSHSNLNSI